MKDMKLFDVTLKLSAVAAESAEAAAAEAYRLLHQVTDKRQTMQVWEPGEKPGQWTSTRWTYGPEPSEVKLPDKILPDFALAPAASEKLPDFGPTLA